MIINGHKLNIEVRDSAEERAAGLSSRDFLPENSGMLFVFDSPGIHKFWMKDMQFDLDFIWIRDGKVVQITPNVSKDSKDILSPSENVDMVLEVNSGWTAQKGIKVGDGIDLTK